MSKEALVGELSDVTGFTKKACETFLSAMPQVLVKMLRQGPVRVHNLGTFEIRVRAARVGRNPQTGDPVDIPEKKVLNFKASKTVKEAVA